MIYPLMGPFRMTLIPQNRKSFEQFLGVKHNLSSCLQRVTSSGSSIYHQTYCFGASGGGCDITETTQAVLCWVPTVKG